MIVKHMNLSLSSVYASCLIIDRLNIGIVL